MQKRMQCKRQRKNILRLVAILPWLSAIISDGAENEVMVIKIANEGGGILRVKWTKFGPNFIRVTNLKQIALLVFWRWFGYHEARGLWDRCVCLFEAFVKRAWTSFCINHDNFSLNNHVFVIFQDSSFGVSKNYETMRKAPRCENCRRIHILRRQRMLSLPFLNDANANRVEAKNGLENCCFSLNALISSDGMQTKCLVTTTSSLSMW
jgi:hypothetical protein